MGRIIDIIRLSRPLFKKEIEVYEDVARYVSDKNLKQVKKLIKLGKVEIKYVSFALSPKMLEDTEYPQIYIKKHDAKDALRGINEFLYKANSEITKEAKKIAFKKFSKVAKNAIPALLAPNIVGMEAVKQAVSLQLFSMEKVHILLLGDPGTGKTDIIRFASEMAPISSFGLGSGTSGVGLSLMMKGGKAVKGLLPLADNGLCCIDELNLMKEEDTASLYNAMEKGFVSYDKADTHLKMDARVNVLATANPKGDKFVLWHVGEIKKQIPFDAALLTRFHLVFLVKAPGVKEFEQIAKKIVSQSRQTLNSNDAAFIKDYIDSLSGLDVELPENLEKKIVSFSKGLKEKEGEFIVEINPRLVHGIIRLAKASAKMNMRNTVTEEDLEIVEMIVKESLKLPK